MKVCTKCKKTKKEEEFYIKNRKEKRLASKCKECYRKDNHKRYMNGKGMWIYIIKIDEKIIYIGSTTQLASRLSVHRNPNGKNGVIYKARKAGLDLENSKVDFYVCNLEDMGLSMDIQDLRYYEHSLIKFFQNKGEDLLNIRDKSRFVNRNRFINEVPISVLDFDKYYTFYIE